MKICEGKKIFPSWALAEKGLRRHGDDARTIFYCPQCRGFHLGHKATKLMLWNRKKSRISKAIEADHFVRAPDEPEDAVRGRD